MSRGGLRGAHKNDGKPLKFPPELRGWGGAAEEFLVKWSAWSRSGHACPAKPWEAAEGIPTAPLRSPEPPEVQPVPTVLL